MRETDRQIDRQRERDRDRQTKTQRHRHTYVIYRLLTCTVIYQGTLDLDGEL